MYNKRVGFYAIVFALLIALSACAPKEQTNEVETTATENLVETYPDSFTYLGDIGNEADYSVWLLERDGDICYIVLDEYIANVANSNAAPGLECSFDSK